MTSYKHISAWQLQRGTNNLWRGINCTGADSVVVVKEIGCWTLDIKNMYPNGSNHVSSHNTRDEAMRYAEIKTSWEVDINFNPIT